MSFDACHRVRRGRIIAYPLKTAQGFFEKKALRTFFSALGDLIVTGPDPHQRQRLPRDPGRGLAPGLSRQAELANRHSREGGNPIISTFWSATRSKPACLVTPNARFAPPGFFLDAARVFFAFEKASLPLRQHLLPAALGCFCFFVTVLQNHRIQ
jgi:hypothetical protein